MEISFANSTADNKNEQYKDFYEKAQCLIEGENDIISVMANITAALKEAFGFFWTGFYIVKGDELTLGPFQGSVACYRIKKGRGVCGTAWAEKCTQVVADVENFPGHIACSSLSKSEIVVPMVAGGEVKAVLDIDSDRLATFDDTDREWLERITAMISHHLYKNM